MSFEEINGQLTTLFERWVEENDRLFAWRGVVDASWPLHSSLYRRLLWTSSATAAPDERAIASAESEVLTNVHRWGLHNGDRGRLSILSQLATLESPLTSTGGGWNALVAIGTLALASATYSLMRGTR